MRGRLAIVVLVACGARTALDDAPSAGTPTSPAPVPAPTADAAVPTPPPARCGDGIVAPGIELCDDGNRIDDDACRNTCGPASCGDGIVQPPETCDDGNAVDGDACLSSCVKPFCGDGVTWLRHEECDDGNGIDSDGCNNECEKVVCGDGVKARTEGCDLGAANGDRPAFLVSQASGTRIATNPIVRKQSSVDFYDYRSASSHTGFEQVRESRAYLYADSISGELALVVTHGIDADASDQVQPDSQLQMDITGIPLGFTIDVVDDTPQEFFSNGPTSAAGRWHFNGNSDGGVIGHLPFPGAWKITVTPRFEYGISSWGFVDHDLKRNSLVMTEPITIEAFDRATACRKTCTIPVCGDGILDGGEVCDDGNTVGGDGCNSTCTALR